MGKITIYRFQVYDISVDENRLSRRWATLEAIERVRGAALNETAAEVDDVVVGSEIPGMTARDFDPRRHTGLQQMVDHGF